MKFDLHPTLDDHVMMRFATTVTTNSISLTIPFFDKDGNRLSVKPSDFLTSGKGYSHLCLMKPDTFQT